MTHHQEKCELILDHNPVWDGSGYHCSKCSLAFIPAPSPHTEGWEEIENEFGAAFLTITNQKTWKDGKPVFYGRKYVTVYNALLDVVKNIVLSTRSADITAFKGMIEEEIIPSKNIPIMANGIWVGKKDPLIVRHNKTLKELTKKLQEYERSTP